MMIMWRPRVNSFSSKNKFVNEENFKKQKVNDDKF
jgi:hypothetical protein